MLGEGTVVIIFAIAKNLEMEMKMQVNRWLPARL